MLACFPLARAAWLRELDDGDLFFGRIPFPFRRHDHTLFTWPLAASALFLIARVDTWDMASLGAVGEANLPQVEQVVMQLVDLFCDDYFEVNDRVR